MKKLLIISAVAILANLTSWADTTNILSKVNIAIAGRLIPAGTAVTGKDLSGNPIPISRLDLQVISGSTTQEVAVLGQVTLSGTSTNVTVLLKESAHVDLPPVARTGNKFVTVFNGSTGSASNAVLLVYGTLRINKATNATINATMEGIWVDGSQAIEGSVTTVPELPPAHLITVRAGKEFTIQLISNPSTGYGWQLAQPLDGRIVTFVSNIFHEPSINTVPVIVGQSGLEVWTFQALHSGSTTIALKYVRAWESNSPPAASESYTIRVQ